MPTVLLLFAVLHLPKGRLKHLYLGTLLIFSIFGWLFFPRLSLLLMLGQEKQGSNYSIQLLCNISWIQSYKVSSKHLQSCKIRDRGPSEST